MKFSSRYIVPALASIALTATVALAQMPPGPGGRGPNRTPPTAEQMAAHRVCKVTTTGMWMM